MDLVAFRTALAASSEELNPEIVELVLTLVRPAAELILVEDPEDEDDQEDGDPTEQDQTDDDEDDDGDGVYVGLYGGLPPLSPELDWPGFDGEPLTLLAQLHCQVLADLLGDEWTLPRNGVLLFFNAVWRTEPEAARVLHVPDDAPVRDAPDGAEVIPPQWMGAWARRSVPDMGDPALGTWLYDDPPALMAVLERLEPLVPYNRHQVLGWLGDGYGPGHEAGFRPLLQLEGEKGTAWGELVRLAFVIPDEDLRTGRLDRVRMAYEVA